jgi:beta-aspartyl-peptidase (threonine type)
MKPALIIHGGAGSWDDNQDILKAESLKKAASIGWEIIEAGGSALDAIEKATNWMEDDPLFDAGTGSYLNEDGVVQMDAIIIDPTTRNFGAVAGVERVRYPISLARKVLEETDNNFFVGAGADALAAKMGIPLVPNLSLATEHDIEVFRKSIMPGTSDTVGVVAIDKEGKLAVATSTGGTPFKIAGRVGDAPIFGAGGYADEFGGTSATGVGEYSLRVMLSKRVVDYIAAGMDAQTAAEAAMTYVDSIFGKVSLGVITIDMQGRLGAVHSSEKLACGWIDKNGVAQATMIGGVK